MNNCNLFYDIKSRLYLGWRGRGEKNFIKIKVEFRQDIWQGVQQVGGMGQDTQVCTQ